MLCEAVEYRWLFGSTETRATNECIFHFSAAASRETRVSINFT